MSLRFFLFYFIGWVLLFSFACQRDNPANNGNPGEEPGTEEQVIHLESKITRVLPMTGIVFWTDSQHNDLGIIQLEFSYMTYDKIVEEKGVYNWNHLEHLLDEVAARGNQAIIRFRYTYPGERTGVPKYIKNHPDYNETKGESEGLTTYFPDWSFEELRDFTLEFYSHLAARYDLDPRLAFLQVGFGLWAEYHIYDGPLKLGKTFPSKEFQARFIQHLDGEFQHLHWSISIDAANGDITPFASQPGLLDSEFGLFDDSFLHKDHHLYNADCFEFFGTQRWQKLPIGGELSYMSQWDQEHALDKNGPHGISFEELSQKYHVSYMIGNDQLQYQTRERVKEAGMGTGYAFTILSFKTINDTSRLLVKNTGIAPIYYDAYITVNGIRCPDSLKDLLPGQEKEYTVASGGTNPILTIQCDHLLPDQKIQYNADL